VVLILPERLVTEVVAVHQEQDSFGLRVLEQSPAERAGGERLSCAGGHLDQRTRIVLRDRRFETVDRVDLAVAKPRRVERRQVLKTKSQRVLLPEPGMQRLWFVKCKDTARTRSWVSRIAEVGFGAGGFVREGKL